MSEFPASLETLRRVREDPHRLGHRGHGPEGPVLGAGHGVTGPASKRIIVGYGFWIFLLSDIVMFACFFAAYAVLQEATAGGPTAAQIVEMPRVALQTGALLLSSYTCGLSFAATNAKSRLWTQVFLLLTGLLGLAFVAMELQEFISLAERGATPQRSAFLSAFFGLVGLHGLHVTVAGLWLATMMAQVQVKGFRREIVHRLICFNLFWHALDIVWIGVFTIVYLMGSLT
ncbi:cytochrome c oxidase subunit 3 [Phenylobacterium sp. LjRoot219]|uniref:cytochrome c oxidase subunit 3 n=1 Tax=Phenylobacterium sp. LjRoot219 TaxID=3342283 RepID=UPI003ECE2A49